MSDKHPPVTVLPATPPTFSALPGAAVDTGDIHRAPLLRALAEERAHADRLAGTIRYALEVGGPCACPRVVGGPCGRCRLEAALAAHEARRRG